MPKVSVIIPTYNRIESLRLAIKSVLAQTFQDFEIIVVDDASHDNTAEVVARFKDERIRYIRHGTNKKISASRNTGVLNSQGRYIAFLDDDDEWLSEKLQLEVDLLENSPLKTGAVYTGFYKIDKVSGATVVQVPTKKGFIFNDMLTQNWLGTSTVLLKKECFEKVGLFDESINFGEDYDMWIRISKEFQFEYIEEPLVKYSASGNKISNDYDKVIKGYEILIDKYHKLFARNRKSCSRFYLSLGVLYCYNKNPAKGRKAFLKAIQIYPLEIRHYFNFGLSLLGTNNFKRLKDLKEALW